MPGAHAADPLAGVRFATGPLVDHHCHGVVRRDLDGVEFEAMLTEASRRSPLGTSPFDSMIGLAVRRWCAPVVGLDPSVSAEDYLSRRLESGVEEVNRRFVAAAGIAAFLVDTGYSPEPICTPSELADLAGGAGHEIVRLEALGQEMLAQGVGAGDFAEQFVAALKSATAVGAKSIAAYRVGLSLPAAKPSDDDLVTALRDVQPDRDGAYRIAHPVLNGWLAWTAIEVGLPLQFHVGYGDNDVDLLQCDPLRLTAFLRATQARDVPVMLLHNYPFHRNAAYLAQVFDHVFMDVGLATHNAGALSKTIIRESLELAPFGKMLFSSDAFGLAELYYLGALLFRRGLSGVLSDLVDAQEMTEGDAEHAARLICAENARRVYRLEA